MPSFKILHLASSPRGAIFTHLMASMRFLNCTSIAWFARVPCPSPLSQLVCDSAIRLKQKRLAHMPSASVTSTRTSSEHEPALLALFFAFRQLFSREITCSFSAWSSAAVAALAMLAALLAQPDAGPMSTANRMRLKQAGRLNLSRRGLSVCHIVSHLSLKCFIASELYVKVSVANASSPRFCAMMPLDRGTSRATCSYCFEQDLYGDEHLRNEMK